MTIEDVTVVVDAGRVKETAFDASRGLARLVETWVSQAAARQRRGRAGRVRCAPSPHASHAAHTLCTSSLLCARPHSLSLHPCLGLAPTQLQPSALQPSPPTL